MNYLNIQNNFLTVTKYHNNTDEIIARLNEFVLNNDCNVLCVDISILNMIDAIKVGTLCATTHFTKHPTGTIELIVKDIESKMALKVLGLRTLKITIKRPIIENFYQPVSRKVVALR